MRLSEQQADFRRMVNQLWNYADKHHFYKNGKTESGRYLKVTCWNRTFEEQKRLVEKGVSWTLRSKHLKGLAVDLLIMKDGQPVYHDPLYGFLGYFWEKIGGTWGGSWTKKNDVYHFEYNKEKRLTIKGV